MSKGKRNKLQIKENIENKRLLKYKRFSSKIFTKITLKFLLIVIFYNSIILTGEKSFGTRFLENSSTITVIIKGKGTKQILSNEFSNSYASSMGDTAYINGNKQSAPFFKECELTNE